MPPPWRSAKPGLLPTPFALLSATAWTLCFRERRQRTYTRFYSQTAKNRIAGDGIQPRNEMHDSGMELHLCMPPKLSTSNLHRLGGETSLPVVLQDCTGERKTPGSESWFLEFFACYYFKLDQRTDRGAYPDRGGSHSAPSRSRSTSGGGNLVTKKRSDHHHSEQKSVTRFPRTIHS